MSITQPFLVTMFCEPRGERWERWVDASSPEEALQKWCRRKHVARALLSEQPWQFIVYDEITAQTYLELERKRSRRIEYRPSEQRITEISEPANPAAEK